MTVIIVSCTMLSQEKNFPNYNSYYVGDFNIKIADSHPDTGISEEHFVLEVIPRSSMKLYIKG